MTVKSSALSELFKQEDADHFLLYGYIDDKGGFSFEVLCPCLERDDSYVFMKNDQGKRTFVSADTLKDTDIKILDEEGYDLEEYRDIVDMINSSSGPDDEVAKTREMTELDELRDPVHVDDVTVYLFKDGLEFEECTVRMLGTNRDMIIGELLHDPVQNFGYRTGERIAFFLSETNKGKTVALADMNPEKVFRREELEDGSVLKEAIEKLKDSREEDDYLEVIELLRDSYVWIPCTAVLGNDDRQKLEDIAKSTDEDFESLKGTTFTNTEEIRMVPDILENNGDFYFPVFSSIEEAGEYGRDFSFMEKHFLQAISLCENNEKNLKGIVVNAFSDYFILEKGTVRCLGDDKKQSHR
ncbi:MAG: SseB family protein [Erysipelotrichaceae bacterium]|nr:SseB family protein [Erysipelotrichaceae bacterium]